VSKSRAPKASSPKEDKEEISTKQVKSGSKPKTPKRVKKEAPTGDVLSPEERLASDQRAKTSLLLGIIVPWLIAPLFGVTFEGFADSFLLNLPLVPADNDSLMYLVALVMVLSTPHVFYFWTWTNSATWSKMCHKRGLEPFKAFAMCAHFIKGAQFLVLGLWARLYISDPLALLKAMHPLKAVLILQLFGIGQLLNVQVYQKIGEAGVYYGTRLGIHVPWVYGFPFSVVPHPQYFGATLSFWGFFLLIQTPETVQNGLYLLCAVMAAFYAFSSWVEANL